MKSQKIELFYNFMSKSPILLGKESAELLKFIFLKTNKNKSYK